MEVSERQDGAPCEPCSVTAGPAWLSKTDAVNHQPRLGGTGGLPICGLATPQLNLRGFGTGATGVVLSAAACRCLEKRRLMADCSCLH